MRLSCCVCARRHPTPELSEAGRRARIDERGGPPAFAPVILLDAFKITTLVECGGQLLKKSLVGTGQRDQRNVLLIYNSAITGPASDANRPKTQNRLGLQADMHLVIGP